MKSKNYWEECISVAAEECSLSLTQDQLKYLAGTVESWHDNYGYAVYSPPASDIIGDIERECEAKLKKLRDEHERYVRNSEQAIKRAMHVRGDMSVTIGDHGEVLTHDGLRTVRVQ